MRKFLVIYLLMTQIAYADYVKFSALPSMTVEESDGSPTGAPSTLKVTAGTLTDNGDGTFTLNTGGGTGAAGDSIWYSEDNEISPVSVPTVSAITIKANELYADYSIGCDDIITGDTISGLTVRNGSFAFPQTDGATNQVLKTDGSGSLTWQDDTGGGGGDSLWYSENTELSPISDITVSALTVKANELYADYSIGCDDVMTSNSVSTLTIKAVDIFSGGSTEEDYCEITTIGNDGAVWSSDDLILGAVGGDIIIYSGMNFIPMDSGSISLGGATNGFDGLYFAGNWYPVGGVNPGIFYDDMNSVNYLQVFAEKPTGARNIYFPDTSGYLLVDGGYATSLSGTTVSFLTAQFGWAYVDSCIGADEVTGLTVSGDSVSVAGSYTFPVDNPADNQILKYDDASSSLKWEADATGGGGGTGWLNLPVQSAKLTGSSVTLIDAGFSQWRLLMPDAGGNSKYTIEQDNYATWQFRMPNDYSSAPVLKIQYTMVTDSTTTIELGVSLWAVTDADAADMDADSFDTANDGSATVPNTAAYLDEISIALANADSVAAGDLVQLQIGRDSDDAVNDTSSGQIAIRAVQLEYTQ